ncbi:hypothetical protein OG800_50705 (plasmid) [Streptomyces sp. NBC_00445]|uniref:hypothetical protein n=1 Tax=Streptomyces sp. NBC_00445 TaxID=2975745 RepID=UPI002E1A2D01
MPAATLLQALVHALRASGSVFTGTPARTVMVVKSHTSRWKTPSAVVKPSVQSTAPTMALQCCWSCCSSRSSDVRPILGVPLPVLVVRGDAPDAQVQPRRREIVALRLRAVGDELGERLVVLVPCDQVGGEQRCEPIKHRPGAAGVSSREASAAGRI